MYICSHGCSLNFFEIVFRALPAFLSGSDWAAVTSDVPQGTVLRLVLFIQ